MIRRGNPTHYDMIIDWFQFTLHGMSLNEVSQFLYKCDVKELTHTPKGLNGYTDTYTYGHKCHMFKHETREDMGINVMFSGSACRDYEEVFNFEDLIKRLGSLPEGTVKISRIDIAIDYFDTKFSVKTIQNKADKGHMTSRFRTYKVFYEAHIGDDRIGEMVQFGDKSSDLHVVFYNKLKERISQGYKQENLNIKNWLRCELRFRKDQAQKLFEKMVNKWDDTGKIVRGVLRHYLSFKVPTCENRKHQYRADECRWWIIFTENVPRCKLTDAAVSSNIFRKRRWLDLTLTKFISMLYVTDQELFKQILEDGVDKIKKYDLDIINAHFILNNQQILTMNELKEIVSRYEKSSNSN